MTGQTPLDFDVPVHANPARSETEAATLVKQSVASIRHAVRHAIIMAGDEGLNTRDIADRLYDYREIRSQEDFHELAAKANKVATRCLELWELGHVEHHYDPEIPYEYDGPDQRLTTLCKPRPSYLATRGFWQPYPTKRFLHYWATPAGIAAHNEAVRGVTAATQHIIDREVTE